jgi:predicted DCC family thiol-disulfide oxidoreductase YuxK
VEIEAYRRRAEAAGVALVFEPLPAAPAWGLTEDEAARRLHVRAGGRVLAGMPAFRALWRATPGMGWLARLSAWPLVAPALGWSYDRIAAPLLHALHRRRLRRRGARPDSAGPGPAA